MQSEPLTQEDLKLIFSMSQVLAHAGFLKQHGADSRLFVRKSSDPAVKSLYMVVNRDDRQCQEKYGHKRFDAVSFVKSHPDLFAESRAGLSPRELVSQVFSNLNSGAGVSRCMELPIRSNDRLPFDPAWSRYIMSLKDVNDLTSGEPEYLVGEARKAFAAYSAESGLLEGALESRDNLYRFGTTEDLRANRANLCNDIHSHESNKTLAWVKFESALKKAFPVWPIENNSAVQKLLSVQMPCPPEWRRYVDSLTDRTDIRSGNPVFLVGHTKEAHERFMASMGLGSGQEQAGTNPLEAFREYKASLKAAFPEWPPKQFMDEVVNSGLEKVTVEEVQRPHEVASPRLGR